MYDKVPNNMNFVEREVQVEKYWKDNDIFRQEHQGKRRRTRFHLL